VTPNFRLCFAKLRVTHCRVHLVSLVCKRWQRVEREHPHRPVQLQLKAEDFDTGFFTLSWHLRDVSRLVEVEVLGYAHGYYHDLEWVLGLLSHLSHKAPALHSLILDDEFLQSVGSQG